MSTATASVVSLLANRKGLLAAFQAVSSVVPTRSPKPILQNIKLVADEAAGSILMATDLETGIRCRVLGVKVNQPGSLILPTARMQQILATADDEELAIEVDGDRLTVRGLRSQFHLPTESPDLFPEVPDFEATSYHAVAASDLRRLIRRTTFATDVESTRYALGGCLVEFEGASVAMVGTDGRRLARQAATVDVEGEPEVPETAVLPVKALKLIDRNIGDDDPPVHIAFKGKNAVLVRTADAVIYSRLVEGRFPKYQDVFPKESGTRVDFMAGELRSVVEQAMITTSDESRGVDFEFGADGLVLSSTASDVGRSRVEMSLGFDAAPVAVTFDPRYLIDALKAVGDEMSLAVDVIDGKNAVVLRTEDGYSYVVMPLTRER